MHKEKRCHQSESRRHELCSLDKRHHLLHKTTRATMKIVLWLQIRRQTTKTSTEIPVTYSIFKLFCNHPKSVSRQREEAIQTG